MSGPLDRELRDALAPTEGERAALSSDAPAWAPALRAATLPTAGEVAALRPRARRRSPLPLAATALLAAALVLAWALWPARPELVPTGQLLVLGPTAEAHLTPDAKVSGTATLVVRARDPAGATLELEAGQAVFEVDPQGSARAIAVRAGEVEVTVTGTRFLVAREGEEVVVAVQRGSVRVEGPEVALDLVAGQRWRGTGYLSGPPTPTAAPPTDSPAEPPASPPASPPATTPPAASPPAASPPAPPPPVAASSPRAAAEAWAGLLDARDHGVPAELLLPRVEAFLDQHGDSALGSEAAFLWIELVVEAWPAERALVALEAWLVANPTSPRLAEGHLFRARLLLGEDPPDCAAARPSLALALRRGGPSVVPVAERLCTRCGGCD